MITFMTKDVSQIGTDKKMACRFMGCKSTVLSEEMADVYEESLELYMSVAEPKAVVRKTFVSFGEDDEVIFDFGSVKSESLRKNLEGCESAYVFAATVGIGVDRMMKRLSVSSKAEMMVFSCIASSGIECWCDFINGKLAETHTLKPRFSPGYGGVSLEIQKDIFRFLEAEKMLGLTLTESLLMVPVKSVTAFVGIAD